MGNLKSILEELVNNDTQVAKILEADSISDLYEICIASGYQGTVEDFRNEFEKLSEEAGISELDNSQLLDVCGGASLNKRLPSLALAVLALGGGVSESGFTKATDLNIQIPSISLNGQVPESQKNTEKSRVKDILNKVRDKTVEIKDLALEKGTKFVKENPGKTAAIAAGTVGGVVILGTAVTLGIKALLNSDENEKIIDSIVNSEGHTKEESLKSILSILTHSGKEKEEINDLKKYYHRKRWDRSDNIVFREKSLPKKLETLINKVENDNTIKKLSKGLKFMDVKEGQNLIKKKKNDISNEEQVEFINLFYSWQILLVRARKLAIREGNYKLFPLLCKEMIRISNAYKLYGIDIPKEAQKLIDISKKELELYGKFYDRNLNDKEYMIDIAKNADSGMEALNSINIDGKDEKIIKKEEPKKQDRKVNGNEEQPKEEEKKEKEQVIVNNDNDNGNVKLKSSSTSDSSSSSSSSDGEKENNEEPEEEEKEKSVEEEKKNIQKFTEGLFDKLLKTVAPKRMFHIRREWDPNYKKNDYKWVYVNELLNLNSDTFQLTDINDNSTFTVSKNVVDIAIKIFELVNTLSTAACIDSTKYYLGNEMTIEAESANKEAFLIGKIKGKSGGWAINLGEIECFIKANEYAEDIINKLSKYSLTELSKLKKDSDM